MGLCCATLWVGAVCWLQSTYAGCTSLVSGLVDAEVQDDALTVVPPIELCMALARRSEKIMAPSAPGRLGRSHLCLP
jgi:hypothetical protein